MRVIILLLILTGALAVSGCGPGRTIPTLPPTASGAPLFATDEEALAAAEDAYAAYLATSDLIAHEGGVDPDRIAAVATGELYEDAIEGFELFQERGWQSTGATVLLALVPQYVDLVSDDEVVVAYLCIDLSGVDVRDATGESVVSSSRPDRQAYEVAFVAEPERSGLLPSSRSPWEGGGVCD